MNQIEIKAIKTLRCLAVEEINKAKSGHPGIALGAAPIIHTLYKHVLNIDPQHPNWENRDRFVLGAGHGSSLLYSILHLAGFNVTKEDLESFRQLGSKTPGHPELGVTDGVDATSGPLGQGIATSVGLAIAEAHLSSRYSAINHYTYCLCSDAEIQEGIGNEAISLAGHLGLSKLIVLMDSNDIQLDGPVSGDYSENTKLKLTAAGWNYILVKDGNNVDEILKAINKAKKQNKPSFIEVRTIIGFGSSLQGTSKVHGAPIPEEETINFRKEIGGEAFTVSNDVLDFYSSIKENGETLYNSWINAYPGFKYDELNIDFTTLLDNSLSGKATRNIIGKALESANEKTKVLFGGSADLQSSCKVKGGDGTFTSTNRTGRNVLFGVREHVMGAISNGICLHGGLRSYCGGFLVFSDYCKPAIRMSALSNIPTVFIFSHDSVAVGEDGPTHQPIEQLSGLRSIPNLNVFRPANLNETLESLDIAFKEQSKPSVILSTRQDLKVVDEKSDVKHGAYILKDFGTPNLIIIATGSEVSLALDVASEIGNCRVVSMPCVELFDIQDDEYKEKVLPLSIRRRVALEMGEAVHMYKYVGLDGKVINITSLGRSGKANDVIKSFGFDKENIINIIKDLK